MSDEKKSVAAQRPNEAVQDSAQPLAHNFSVLIANPLYSDVSFVVGKEEVKFPAHRFILAARSPVFEAMLYHPTQPHLPLTQPIRIPDTDPNAFMAMLKCIYSDKPEINHDNVVAASVLAKKYQVESLRSICSKFSKRGITIDTACALFEKSPNLALAFIEENARKVFQTKGFLQFSEARLIELLRSNKLDIRELAVWRACLKWAEHQIKERKLADSDEKEKKASLAQVMKNVLPHIRLPLLTTAQLTVHIAPTGLLQAEQLLQLFSYIGGNKSIKIPFSAVKRENPMFEVGWDNDHHSAGVRLSNRNTVATCYPQPRRNFGGGGAQIDYVIGTRAAPKGRVAVRITILQDPTSRMVIGISTRKDQYGYNASYTDASFFGVSCAGQEFRRGRYQATHGMGLRTGVKVDMLIDNDSRTVAFYANGVRHEIPFDAGLYVPHVSFAGMGSVRIKAIKPQKFGTSGGRH